MIEISDNGKATVPLVLHGIIRDNRSGSFEDLSCSKLEWMLEYMHAEQQTHEEKDRMSNHGKQFILTFDDGHISNFELAFPLLKKFDRKALFFVVTDFIGKPGYMDWEQIKELLDAGMFVGSHSHTHPEFTCLSLDEVKFELETSKKILEQNLSNEITMFSFPFGKYKWKHSQLALEIGYQYLFGSQHGLITKYQTTFPRNSINNSMTSLQIQYAMDANFWRRMSWYMEDVLKSNLKSVFGDDRYRKMRDYLLLGR